MNMATDISNVRFSVFSSGYKRPNGTLKMYQDPQQTWTIGDAYKWITSPWAASAATIGYRAMLPTATREQKNNFKVEYFEYATFAGIFRYRNSNPKNLIQRSPYVSLDIDDLPSIDEARKVRDMLCQDQYVETALCFVSPSGHGVKWVVELPERTMGLSFLEQWHALRNHLAFNYGLNADPTGKDVCRACFLGWDPECYINVKYKTCLT